MGRFAREARLLERLVHPNIVRVRAVLELGDAGLAIVMAYVPGRTLKELIRKDGRLAPERAARFTRDIARALGAAHAMGIVHRDVKPENVFVDSDDRPLLADFGLARSMSGDSELTMAGVAIGTPAYMAPEQIDGASLDARGDVYSLGLLAWEMLSGRRPWEGESLYAVLYHQRYEQLPDVRDLRDDVPGPLADAIAVAIEKKPEMRWQNTGQLIEALDGSAPLQRTTTRRPPLNADTVRFTRPSPGAAHIDGPVAPAQRAVVRRFGRIEVCRRRVGGAGQGAGIQDAPSLRPCDGRRCRAHDARGVVAVAASRQGYFSDVRRAPTPLPSGFAVNDSAGRSLPVTQTAASPPTPDSVHQRFNRGARLPIHRRRTRRRRRRSCRERISRPTSRRTRPPLERTRRRPTPRRIPRRSSRPLPVRAFRASRSPQGDCIRACSTPKAAPTAGEATTAGSSAPAVRTPWPRRWPSPATFGLRRSRRACRTAAPSRAAEPRGAGARTNAASSAIVRRWRIRRRRASPTRACSRRSASERRTAARSTAAARRCAGGRTRTASSDPEAWPARSALRRSWPVTSTIPRSLSDGILPVRSMSAAPSAGERTPTGQLGDGSITDRRVPVPVAGGLTFRSIAAGATHACGVTPQRRGVLLGQQLRRPAWRRHPRESYTCRRP